MTSLLVEGASGANGMALAPVTMMPKTKAAAISLFIKTSPDMFSRILPSAAGERDAGADFADRLVDQLQRFFAVAALVRRRGGEFGASRLQQADTGGHVRLRADGVADAHAGGDRGPEQRLAGEGCRHLLVSSEVVQHWPFRSRNAAAPGGSCRRTVKPCRRRRLGLAGASGSGIWTARCCFLRNGVLPQRFRAKWTPGS